MWYNLDNERCSTEYFYSLLVIITSRRLLYLLTVTLRLFLFFNVKKKVHDFTF